MSRCSQCGRKECCGADMESETERLESTLREAVTVLEFYAEERDAVTFNEYQKDKGQQARDFFAAHPELRQREDG